MSNAMTRIGRFHNQEVLSFDHIHPKSAMPPLKSQLLKWIGNKQRSARTIIELFPEDYTVYYEPFVGSGAVLAALSPKMAVASDTLEPLIGIWKTLASNPELVKQWYNSGWTTMMCKSPSKIDGYETIKASYNKKANAADLLVISRSCYGGVVRFRKADGYLSTPCGVHTPISPESFSKRVDLWHPRIKTVEFLHSDFEAVIDSAQAGSFVYCDPPYTHTQAILYRAQEFSLPRLFNCISRAKERGVRIAVSIDGTKKTGNKECPLPIPDGLFRREILIDCGRSMLRRFQLDGETLENEVVHDRLLLTY